MENQTGGSGNEYLDQLKQQMADLKKDEKKSGSNRKTKEEILAKYFVPRKDNETFRILPPLTGKPIQEVFFHSVDLNMPNGKKAFGKALYCPAHNDPMIEKKDSNGQTILEETTGKPVLIPAPCPLCAKNKALLKTQTNDPEIRGKKRDELTEEQQKVFDKNRDIFKDANKWQAKKYYIVRGIDKGKTSDGVKFWRFKKNFKNQGTLDRLLPVLGQYMEQYSTSFFDANTGSDLAITMCDSTMPNGKTFRAISAIIAKPPSKLSDDEIVSRQWLNDKTTWREVFKPKAAPNVTPYEFLEMAGRNEDPYWDDSDSNNRHWVFPGRPDLQEKANQRFKNLDSDDYVDKNFEHASDLVDGVTIQNVTPADVGNFQNAGVANAVDVMDGFSDATNETVTQEPVAQAAPVTQPPVAQEPVAQAPVTPPAQPPVDTNTFVGGDDDGYDNLPF